MGSGGRGTEPYCLAVLSSRTHLDLYRVLFLTLKTLSSLTLSICSCPPLFPLCYYFYLGLGHHQVIHGDLSSGNIMLKFNARSKSCHQAKVSVRGGRMVLVDIPPSGLVSKET